MTSHTDMELLMERIQREYFKDMTEEEQKRWMKLLIYMMLN